jgi:hypothetical protein
MGFGLAIRFTGLFNTQCVTTIYRSLLHIHIIVHCRCLVVAFKGGVALPLGSQTVPVWATNFSQRLNLTSTPTHSLNSTQLTPIYSFKLLLTLACTVVLDSNPVRTHDHIFIFYRLVRVLKWGLLIEERKGLTTTGHPPPTGKRHCWQSLSLFHSFTLSLSLWIIFGNRLV